MALTKTINIDGKDVVFRASAAIPRLYRVKFRRDIYKDFNSLQKAFEANNEEGINFDIFSLELFEDLAWLMAKHADPDVPDTPDEWLEQFNTFSIYQILPKILELWGLNMETESTAKKNEPSPKGK